jgi:ATP-binding cassette, subfamily B, bacterial
VMPALVYLFAGLDGGAISIGTVVAFTTLQTRIFFPIQSLLNVGIDIQTSLALFDRIFQYLDLDVDIAEHDGARDLEDVVGEVRYEDVGFGYDSDSPPVIDHVDLTIPPGTTTAIVGETGSGKTTLAYLAARLYDPTRGRVTIDGVDLREISFRSLAETVGLVSQETYLFHASVRENLSFAKPGATDEEIEAAARAARIHDLIASLPDGYDTVVGERGHRLSGGEKQRVAIARMLLKDPAIVILDEATSHLDAENEALVQEALATALVGRTSIVIAHRLSTIQAADEILVLDRGRIVQRGSHTGLLTQGGLYAELYRTLVRAAPDRPAV